MDRLVPTMMVRSRAKSALNLGDESTFKLANGDFFSSLLDEMANSS